MPLETVPFDAADLLDTPEAQAEFLSLAFETGDAAHIARALGAVARARGMTQVARDVGLTRQGLYKALSEGGDPKLSTLLEVARVLGVRMTVVPMAAK